MNKFKIVNCKEIIYKSYVNGYAVPQININNLEWTKTILEVCNQKRSPIILGLSQGAKNYMGGFLTVINLVNGLIQDLNITVPVCLHLDHGTFNDCLEAIKKGFKSVMYDGSSLPFIDNYNNSKIIMGIANKNNISVELEIGSIGGEEDGIVGEEQEVDISDVIKIFELKPTMLAVGIGNIHGKYPINWKGLNFDLLNEINQKCQKPLVLHGASGLKAEDVQNSIRMGVAKINVNTELQLANYYAIKKFILSGESDQGKNYDPRKINKKGIEAMIEVIKQKIEICDSGNRY